MNKIRQVALAFIIGSSWVSVALWFKWFQEYKRNGKFATDNCVKALFDMELYYFYTLFAPIYIGFMCSCAILIHLYFKYSVRQSFFIISLISPVLVYLAITICNVYSWTQDRYHEQLLRLFIYHSILYNVINATMYEMIAG